MKRHKAIRILDKVKISNGWEFAVGVDEYTYSVKLHKDYWAQLSDKETPPEKLIEAAFKFLLEREKPEQILHEFWLKQIKMYFPDFEEKVGSYL